ncbi:MAG TPA: hypothetical protein VFL13_14740 [Candidatus Baltobacteraceae bacterium]|nr:hypothetical protein [Candidatus Baltobacteraceae bacterium]
MLYGVTFDDWADDIAKRVTAEMPGARFKRRADDICRIIHGANECQLHASSDEFARFVALRRGEPADRGFVHTLQVRIGAISEDDLARRIIGWLRR